MLDDQHIETDLNGLKDHWSERVVVLDHVNCSGNALSHHHHIEIMDDDECLFVPELSGHHVPGTWYLLTAPGLTPAV